MEKLDKTNYQGSKIGCITVRSGLKHLIHKLTNFFGETFSSIDLIFAFQPNMFVKSCVHAPLHHNCHY